MIKRLGGERHYGQSGHVNPLREIPIKREACLSPERRSRDVEILQRRNFP
ncbi:hypothetical protein [Pseudohongiella spirulinae]|nr:hypothetical protein [Pseudohongiella spirulinae]